MSSLKEPELHVVACEVTDPKGCLELFYAAWLDRYASAEIAERPRRDLVYLVDAEAEIDRLRAEVAELAQQRGDLAARVVDLQNDGRKLVRVLRAAVALTCSDSWDDASEEAKALQQTLRDCGFIVASESQPSEQTR